MLDGLCGGYSVEALRSGPNEGRPPEAEQGKIGHAAATKRPTSMPVSFQQERMWILDRIEPGNPAYNIVVATRLTGVLDGAALACAWRSAIVRHPALRCTFHETAHGPEVGLLPEDSPCLSMQTMAIPADDGGGVANFVSAESRRPIDLEAGPLARLTLARLGEREHVLCLVVHHIVADGWSLRVLIDDLRLLYNREVGAESAGPLSDLRVTYFDYARRQRQGDGRAERRSLQYWRSRLAGAEAVDLPLARPRRALQCFDGLSQCIELGPEIANGVDGLARDARASSFMVLLAAFAATIFRYSGQAQVTVGSPFANRIDKAFDDTVGLFVNTLVLRMDVGGDPAFVDAVGRVRSVVLEAFEHQAVPLDKIVAELQPMRSLSHNPLFQIMFAMQGEPTFFRFDGLASDEIEPATGCVRFDLEFTAWRHPDGLRLRVTWNTGLFSAGTIDRLARDYRGFLQAAVRHPKKSISQLFVSDAQSPDAESPAPPVVYVEGALPLHSLVMRAAEQRPAHAALIDGDAEITYAALIECATRIAARLTEHGLAREEIVALSGERNVNFVAAMLGVMMAGGAFLPIDSLDPADRKRYIAADAGVRILLANQTDTAWAADLGMVVINLPVGTAEGAAHPYEPPDLTSAALAYVLFTSGTTGRPKGVLVEHRNVVNTLLACRAEFGFMASDVVPVIARETFDIFLFELFSPLIVGGTAILVSRQDVFDTGRIAAVLRQATCLQAVPGLMRELIGAMAASGTTTSPTMRQVTTGGDAVPPALLAELRRVFPNAEVSVTYGPTEAAILASRHVVGDDVCGHPLGRPLPNVEIRVCDEAGNPVPPGAVGEIWIGGAGVGRGYLKRPEETSQRFLLRSGMRFFRSGDRGRWQHDGTLEFLGRLDQQLKIRGFRVETGEVEVALAGHTDVDQAVAVPAGETGDKHLIAFVKLTAAGAASLRRTLAANRIAGWRTLFDDVHQTTGDEALDFTGWRSSLDGQAIPKPEMGEWLAETLRDCRQVLAGCRERTEDASVLEVGCGTGLLALSLAPHVRLYDAIDFSGSVVTSLRRRAESAGLNNLHILQSEATDMPTREGDYDLIILNSVVQYFPSSQHVAQVLVNALGRLRPRGALYVGDVRNLGLLTPFYAGIARHRAMSEAGGSLERQVFAGLRDGEEELALAPRFFREIVKQVAGAWTVRIAPKFGRSDNELTRYRYGVIICRAACDADDAPQPTWNEWSAIGGLDALRTRLSTERPRELALRRIPNDRLRADLDAWRALQPEAAPSGAQPGVAPDDLRDLAAQLGYRVELSWAAEYLDGAFDACFIRGGGPSVPVAHWPVPEDNGSVQTANDPLSPLFNRTIEEDLTRYLRERLPDYMIPEAIVPIDQIPLTENQKINRAALPIPHPNSRIGHGRAPRGKLEHLIAKTWSATLGVVGIRANDNFFKIGGTSLTAIQVAVRLRQEGVRASPKDLFQYQTVADLAARLQVDAPGHVVSLIKHVPAVPQSTPRRAVVRDGLDGDGAVIVTGATGFLGIHLIAEILTTTRRHVICPIRGANSAAAKERLAQRWRWYFAEKNEEAFSARVGAIAADLTAPDFAKSVERACASSGADCIFHAAADVRHLAAPVATEAVNVGGTEQVIQVAKRLGGRLHHISTIGVKGVVGPGGRLSFSERDVDIGQRFRDIYSTTKLQAESLVRGFQAEGGDASIYRVGMVGPHSESGHFQRNIGEHFFSRYLRSVILLGMAADWPARQIVPMPVDLLARATVLLARYRAAGETYHLDAPKGWRYGEVRELLENAGYRVRRVDSGEIERAILDPTKEVDEHRVGGLLSFIEASSDRQVSADSGWTHSVLRDLGFVFPELTPAYFRRFLDHAIRQGFVPEPSQQRHLAEIRP